MPLEFHALVLAAGQGTRMKSARAKVLHPVLGRPMLSYPLSLARDLGARSTTVVVGHQAERVQEAFAAWPDLSFALQTEQRGTGHAVLSAREQLPATGTVLILTGDTPLLREETIGPLLEAHAQRNAQITVLAADYPDPAGYGRVVTDADGNVARIVEHKDASPAEKEITLCNTGIYVCDLEVLFTLVSQIRADNAQAEYYLTDVIALARKAGSAVGYFRASDHIDFLGVNDRLQLAEAGVVLQRRIVDDHLRAGVTIIDPARVYIEADVRIGPDSTIEPGVHLAGQTALGRNVTVEMGVRIEESRIADGARIKAHSVVESSDVGSQCVIGPLAHLRPGTMLDAEVHIGNFVETKKTRIGRGSKANHLSYLGDAEIGSCVNVGAGTITCNYDGAAKHKTIIGDGAFIGSDTQLVAPVTVGKGAVVGAGTTVTGDVPDDALAVSRTPQKTIADYRNRKRKKKAP